MVWCRLNPIRPCVCVCVRACMCIGDIALCTCELVNGFFQPPGTCGADFLPSSATSIGTVGFGTQVVLSPAFEGCGRLMGCNVTAACLENVSCNIVFQLWRPTGCGVFKLINSSAVDGYNPTSNSENSVVQVSLSFSLDIHFTAGDMIGFSQISGIRPLDVHRASASNHSYLQWSSVSTLRSMLTTGDATTLTSQLPILNVEGGYTHVMPTLHT